MKKYNIKTTYEKRGKVYFASTSSQKAYQALLDTGAVVEQGVIFKPQYFVSEKDISLSEEIRETNAKPLIPYLLKGDVYCPTYNEDETIKLLAAIKKYASINEELDLRQYEGLLKKIRMASFNMFYGREYGEGSAILKELCFFCWLTVGTCNTIAGRQLLPFINYLTAALQIDYFTLVPMIMASTISLEDKKYLLDTIKSHYINPEAIEKEYSYVGMYAKFENETPSILRKSL